MDVTVEYRSHWIAADGTRHASLRDADGRLRENLRPVLNLDEVRSWLTLAMSHGYDDARSFYTRIFLKSDCNKAERERLAPFVCEELTDDVPKYHSQIRQPFLDMRSRWPSV